MNPQEILSQMTLTEKADLCSGADFWHIPGVPRLGVQPMLVCDGPHGLRKHIDSAIQAGFYEAVSTACFPPSACMANSFDVALEEEVGDALGKDCQAEQIGILLGPGANLKRSPLCGRNFEYFSEDPYLSSRMADGYIRGLQQNGVGCCLKHFAANNQEYRRLNVSDVVDERTLRELYLASFEYPIKHAKPWSIMCSYNRINGTYSSDNRWLLTDLLRKEWGYEGMVMSDWFAVNDRIAGIKAGLNLEMPGTDHDSNRQVELAVLEGKLSMEELDSVVLDTLKILARLPQWPENATLPWEKDHALARKAAAESAVLLKNQDGVLPLWDNQKVAFIGVFAKTPRFQGGGSSHVNAHNVTNSWDAAQGRFSSLTYASGYDLSKDEDDSLIPAAVETAKRADIAVIFAGLPEHYESEGYDRTHLNLPPCQNRLISQVAAVQPNTVVVLMGGSAMVLPWRDEVKAILYLCLGGEAVGEAAVDLLTGAVSPSGRLAETFPLRLEDTPSYLDFPGHDDLVPYHENIFIGYRWYLARKIPVQYPFGYGLSYTSFSYANLRLSQSTITQGDAITATVEVTNTGSVPGAEVVQLYVADHSGRASRPPRELKGFAKVFLQPGETKTVSLELDWRSFAWYDVQLSDWYAQGSFEVQICADCERVLLWAPVEAVSKIQRPLVVTRNSTLDQLLPHPVAGPAVRKLFAKAGITDEKLTHPDGHTLPLDYPIRNLRYEAQLTIGELEDWMEKLNQSIREAESCCE